MTEVRRPSLAVFDIDNTMYPYEPAHRAGEAGLAAVAAIETGLPVAEVHRHFADARARVKERLGRTAASHSRLLYAAEMLESTGFKHQPKLLLQLEQTYWRAFLLEARLRPGVEDLMVALRYNTVPIAVVTDLTLQIQLRKLVHFRIDALIDHLVASEETPSDKWRLDAFRLAIERSGEEVHDHVWFIGDGPDDTPVPQLIDAGVIRGGHGFVLGGRRTEPWITGWHEMREIESVLGSVLGK